MEIGILFYFPLLSWDEWVFKTFSNFVWLQPFFFLLPDYDWQFFEIIFLKWNPMISFFFQFVLYYLHIVAFRTEVWNIFSLSVWLNTFFYIAIVLRRTGLEKMYAWFISHFVTFVKSHMVSCSIVKHGTVSQHFHLNFDLWLCFYLINSIKAWWKEARFAFLNFLICLSNLPF